jgi:hypothetical protein
MNDDSIYWMLAVVVTAFLIAILGFITGRNLPKKLKKMHMRKHAAIWLALVAFSVPVFNPFIFSFSQTEFLDDLKAENLGSVEDLAKFEKEQSRQIELLKEEVKDLRNDLYAVNRFYSTVSQFSLAVIAAFSLSSAFRKRKNEEDLVEIKLNQIPKL